MTCQRPAKRAYRQDDKKLKEFMEETYPKIAGKAKAENADIYWADETGINNQEYYVRGFSARGRTPVIPSFPKIEKINISYFPHEKPQRSLAKYREDSHKMPQAAYLKALW